MISITGSYIIDPSLGTNLRCKVDITDHPFKGGDVVKIVFSTTNNKLKAFEDNYILAIVNAGRVRLLDFPDESVTEKGNIAELTNIDTADLTGSCTLTLQSIKVPASSAVSPELQSLEPSAEIELFKLTFDKDVNGQTIDPYYYHAGTNEVKTNIIFNGQSYTALPVKVTGFNKTTKGTLPRPKFEIANTDSAISALLILYNPLHAELLRIKTCKKFLDASNFSSGSNASADPTAIFEADDRWYVDRVVNENPGTVVFELTGKIDMTNLRLPKRRYRESKVKI
jgi:lambda family phage minor tail protein L